MEGNNLPTAKPLRARPLRIARAAVLSASLVTALGSLVLLGTALSILAYLPPATIILGGIALLAGASATVAAILAFSSDRTTAAWRACRFAAAAGGHRHVGAVPRQGHHLLRRIGMSAAITSALLAAGAAVSHGTSDLSVPLFAVFLFCFAETGFISIALSRSCPPDQPLPTGQAR